MTGPEAARGPRAVARFLRPRSVAIVGMSARAGSAGQVILQSLKLNSFNGDIHLVGRSAEPIDGRPVLKSPDDLPEGVLSAGPAVVTSRDKDNLTILGNGDTIARSTATGTPAFRLLDVEGVEVEAIKGGARLLQGDSVLLCEEHGNDPSHTVSRFILEKTPLELIVYDPSSNRLETVTELSILDRIKVSSHVGYNVFGTASAFWLARIDALNAKAGRRVQ